MEIVPYLTETEDQLGWTYCVLAKPGGPQRPPVAASSTLAQAACSHRAVKPSSQDPSEDVRICWVQTTLFSFFSTPVAVCVAEAASQLEN